MDANLHELLARVERSITRVQAARAARFNLSWPLGHPDRDLALGRLQEENPSLFEAVRRIEQLAGPGADGCDRVLAE